MKNALFLKYVLFSEKSQAGSVLINVLFFFGVLSLDVLIKKVLIRKKNV